MGIDATTHRLRALLGVLGEGKGQVRAAGVYTVPAEAAAEAGGAAGAGAAVNPFAFPELAGRTAVATLADLEAAIYPLGQPAPRLVLPAQAGGAVGVADLAGSVVVLDFWATWCVPCWTALRHTAELESWARGARLAVKVYAIDTLETDKTEADQRRRVADFLRAKGLAVPALLDVGGKAFGAFHNPGLPSLVILDREGRLARYHSGLLPEMLATVKGEVQELLAARPDGNR